METLTIILILSGVIILLCVVALFEQQWLDLNKTIFQMLVSPVAVGEEKLQTFWAKVRSFYRGQFSNKTGEFDLRIVFYRFIGSVLYTTSFALFVFADFHLMCLTLAGMGIEASHFEPPVGAGTLTVLALVAGILFFGTLLLDLIGMTNIAPWREKLSPLWSKVMYYICIFSLFLSLIIAILCGVWRGNSLIEEDVYLGNSSLLESTFMTGGLTDSKNSPSFEGMASERPPEDSNLDKMLIFINMAIPTLFLLGGIFSGYGAVELIKLLMLAVIFIFLSPSGILLIILAYTLRIIERIYDVSIALISLLNTMGRWLMGLFNYSPPDNSTYQSTPSEEEPSSSEEEPSSPPNNKEESEEGTDVITEAGWDPYKSHTEKGEDKKCQK